MRAVCTVEGCDWPRPCPRDTDGDGDCGRAATCIVEHQGCGLYRIAPDTTLRAALDLGCAAIAEVTGTMR